MADKGHAIVVGAGIVGACVAYDLLRDGFRVSLVEKDRPGRAASLGNSGSIGLASVTPFGVPGLVRKAPRMFLDPMHPLSVRLGYLPRAVPWFLRFASTLKDERVRRIAAARAALLRLAPSAYDELLASIHHPEMIYNNGLLFAYERPDGPQRNAYDIGLRRANGVRVEVLDGDGVRELEPAVSTRIQSGVYYPDVRTSVHPGRMTEEIVAAFVRAGGRLVTDEVRGFVCAGGRASAVIGGNGNIACDTLVIAAGAWSRTLMKRLGVRVPIVAERGYNITIADHDVNLRIPVVAGDRHVSIVAMDGAIRMTTGAEFAEIDAPPDFDKALRIFKAAAGTITGLEVNVKERWMGSRPSTPDSLPVIGRSPSLINVLCAFGHGHLGVTFGAITGRAIADLAAGRPPPLDLAPYRVDRPFDGSHLPTLADMPDSRAA
jgi:D-amino-acid dehydrogenase